MKIHVNRIPAEGLHEEAAYDPKVLDVERFDLHMEEPIAVSSLITKAENAILVQAQIRCRVRLSCARCLEPFEFPMEMAATLSYQVRPGDVVDITEDIRQEIILAYPMIPVCQQACKGLCPACGQNLNAGSCVHEATTAE